MKANGRTRRKQRVGSSSRLESSKAPHGERMLEVRIRFWTNAIADKDEHVVPKHAWDSGVVLIDRNETHGITPQAPVPFNSLLHLPAVIERVLIKQGVKLHHARSRKYYAEITR